MTSDPVKDSGQCERWSHLVHHNKGTRLQTKDPMRQLAVCTCLKLFYHSRKQYVPSSLIFGIGYEVEVLDTESELSCDVAR